MTDINKCCHQTVSSIDDVFRKSNFAKNGFTLLYKFEENRLTSGKYQGFKAIVYISIQQFRLSRQINQ